MPSETRRIIPGLYDLKDRIESIAPFASFERPIFIIAPPRSGSTFLFNCLSQCDELYYIWCEADLIWWRHFPYERLPEQSDYVHPRYATAANARRIRRHTYQFAIRNHLRPHSHVSKALRWLPYLFGLKRIRYLDKTIANCFHLEFLERAFPGARYVFLLRDPRANVSSMLESWGEIERMGKPQLTPIISNTHDATISHWAFPAPPGWQKVINRPLAQICAWSWQQHVEHALSFFAQRPEKATIVRYEELVEDTPRTIGWLAEELNLKLSPKAVEYATESPLSHTTTSKPYTDKWKTKNYQQIMAIWPAIKETGAKIGYA